MSESRNEASLFVTVPTSPEPRLKEGLGMRLCTSKYAAEMNSISLIVRGSLSLSHPNVGFQVHNLHVTGLYLPQSFTLLRRVQENLQHTSHMTVT